ncbi:hypothetical protein [Streptomyces sp. NPDC047706]
MIIGRQKLAGRAPAGESRKMPLPLDDVEEPLGERVLNYAVRGAP